MTALDRVMAYAAAFEETYRDDDWSRLEPHFADDAVYEVVGGPLSCTLTGPKAILRGMKKSVDGLDRRLDTRSIELTDGPHADPAGDRVEIGWKASYERAGAPDLVFAGRSTATVADDRILRLVDTYDDDDVANITAWLAAHGQDLDPSYT